MQIKVFTLTIVESRVVVSCAVCSATYAETTCDTIRRRSSRADFRGTPDYAGTASDVYKAFDSPISVHSVRTRSSQSCDFPCDCE